MSTTFFRFAWLLTLGITLGSGVLRAQSKADVDAQAHIRLGQAHYEDGAFLKAAEEFEKAYELSERPLLLVDIYFAYRDANAQDKAEDAFRRYVEIAGVSYESPHERSGGCVIRSDLGSSDSGGASGSAGSSGEGETSGLDGGGTAGVGGSDVRLDADVGARTPYRLDPKKLCVSGTSIHASGNESCPWVLVAPPAGDTRASWGMCRSSFTPLLSLRHSKRTAPFRE